MNKLISIKDVKMPSRETKAAMIADAPLMSRERFNTKYPDFAMNRNQYEHFVTAINRGDKI